MASKAISGRIRRGRLTNQFIYREFLLFAFAAFVSLILHILIIFSVYFPANFISMPLTGGMIFSWLYSSSIIKDISLSRKDFNFKFILTSIHPFLKYILAFLVVYTFVNFINTFSVHSGESWVDFDLDYNRLRGISGFWLLFYIVGLLSSYLKVKLLKEDQKE